MNTNNQEFDSLLFQNNKLHMFSKFYCDHMEQTNHLYIDECTKTPLIANGANNQNLQNFQKARTNNKDPKLHFVSFDRNGQHVPIIPLPGKQDEWGYLDTKIVPQLLSTNILRN